MLVFAEHINITETQEWVFLKSLSTGIYNLCHKFYVLEYYAQSKRRTGFWNNFLEQNQIKSQVYESKITKEVRRKPNVQRGKQWGKQ